jgi:hypothetical protein
MVTRTTPSALSMVMSTVWLVILWGSKTDAKITRSELSVATTTNDTYLRRKPLTTNTTVPKDRREDTTIPRKRRVANPIRNPKRDIMDITISKYPYIANPKKSIAV